MRTDVVYLDCFENLTNIAVEFRDACIVNDILVYGSVAIKNTKTGNYLNGKSIGPTGWQYSRNRVIELAKNILKAQFQKEQTSIDQVTTESSKMVNLDLKNKQYIIATQNYAFMTEKGNEDLYYQLEDHDVQLDKVTAIIEVGSYELIGTKFQMVAVQ